jgi:transposase
VISGIGKKYYAEFMLFKKNMSTRLCIDETYLSQVELYTIFANKAAKGKKGSLVAIIRGVKSENTLTESFNAKIKAFRSQF